MRIVGSLVGMLAPPRCVACGAACPALARLCEGCVVSLAAARPPSVPRLAALDLVWAAFPNEGVARELVVALKFRRLLPVAAQIADLVAQRAPGRLISGTLVPVPAAYARLRRRGFDPAEEIALQLMSVTGLPAAACLARADGSRQVGRSRAARIAKPPQVQASGEAPADVLLVDDVLTTGATLSACARALREAGSARVSALTFARTL